MDIGFVESYDCSCCGAVSRRNNLAVTGRGLLLLKDNSAEAIRREQEKEVQMFEAKRIHQDLDELDAPRTRPWQLQMPM